jgi:hypothetical protein
MKTALTITFTHEGFIDRDELVDVILDAVVETFLTTRSRIGDRVSVIKVTDKASGEEFSRGLDE